MLFTYVCVCAINASVIHEGIKFHSGSDNAYMADKEPPWVGFKLAAGLNLEPVTNGRSARKLDFQESNSICECYDNKRLIKMVTK